MDFVGWAAEAIDLDGSGGVHSYVCWSEVPADVAGVEAVSGCGACASADANGAAWVGSYVYSVVDV